MREVLAIIGMLLALAGVVGAALMAAVGLVFAFSFVSALPVWLLWNWLCPTLWGWPELGLLQAWGLTLLCAFLFRAAGSFRSSQREK